MASSSPPINPKNCAEVAGTGPEEFAKNPKSDDTFGKIVKRSVLLDDGLTFFFFLFEIQSTTGLAHNFLFPDELFEFICLNNAVKCATVLLQFETAWRVDVNATLAGGFTPLQIAAQRLSYPMIQLFLLHGAHPNHLPAADHPVDVEKLPLCLALESMRKQFLTDWNRRKSIFDFIWRFCFKESNESFAAVKLLASRTEELEMICKHYLEKREILQLAALLQVSWHAWLIIWDELYSVDSQRRIELTYAEGMLLKDVLSCRDHIENARRSQLVHKPRTPPPRKGMGQEEDVENLEPGETLWERLKPLILKDKFFEFSRLLRRSTDGCAHNLLFPGELFELICLKNAVKCATVLLEHDTSWRVNLNAPWKGGCLTPLQIAAMRLSYPLIELFLLHGAVPSHVPCLDVGKLPLLLALKSLRKQLSDWSPEKSVFKLFYIFCLKELRKPLAAVKLLASRTEELEMICKHYLEKGEIHQLAALLQISWHALVNPSPDHDKGFEAFQIWQSICNELKSVSLSDSQRRTELQSAHKLLSVLYKARDYIEYFRLLYSNREAHDVPFLIANDLVRTTKISMKPEDVFSDDVKCLMPRISATRKAWLDKQIQKQMKSGFAASSEPRSKLYSRACRPKSADPDEADKEESDDEYDPTDLEESLKRIFKQDNKDEFVKLMKSWPCDDVAALVFVLDMFEYDAVKCAGAILNGGEITDWKLRLDTFLFRIGYTPLHRSADHAALKLTGFLLDHGENANVPISTRTGDILPLHYALKKISYDNWWWKWWRHNKSVFGLLIICLWNKGLYLENVRLFAEHTKDIQLVVDKFVQERNLIELGILMLLGYRPSPKLLSVLKLDAKEPNDQLLGKMLEVFERIGNKLQAYSKIKWWISQNVVTEVYSLFEDAELVVTSKEIPIAEYDHLQHLQGARG